MCGSAAILFKAVFQDRAESETVSALSILHLRRSSAVGSGANDAFENISIAHARAGW